MKQSGMSGTIRRGLRNTHRCGHTIGCRGIAVCMSQLGNYAYSNIKVGNLNYYGMAFFN